MGNLKNWFIQRFTTLNILAVVVVFGGCVMVPFVTEYSNGAEYQIRLPTMSEEQCQYASENSKDITFLEVRSEIDPCTLQYVYYYCYKVVWKTDAKGWLIDYLEKEGINLIKIETYEGSK